MTFSGFVLLIVCANVANLMLVRGLERRRQTSLSMALGARASRLVREALTESILLSLALGGGAGLAIAFESTRLILHFAFPSLPGFEEVPIQASPSTAVLLFAFGISLATGIAFGIAPAWMATRVDPIEALRGASRSTARTGSLPRRTLVVFQAALSLVLLSASGLLTATLHRLENQNLGFDQDGRTIVAKIGFAGYRAEQLTPLYRRIHDSLSGIPGVSAVALCIYSPLEGNNWGTDIWVDGHPPPGPNDDNFVSLDRVTPGYFDAIGNQIIRGRGIWEQDTVTSRHVAVINEALARKFFKQEDPIGKHFGGSVEAPSQYEIVGVAKDARYLTSNLDKPIGPFYFLPEAQHDFLPKAR